MGGTEGSVGGMDELGETMYLVSRMLAGRSELQGTLQALQAELETHGLLGHVRNWKGEARVATLEDVSLQHSRLAPTQLQRHLRRSLDSASVPTLGSSSSSNGGSSSSASASALVLSKPRSLLAPLPSPGAVGTGLLHVQSAMSQLVDALRRRRALTEELSDARLRLHRLRSEGKQTVTLAGGEDDEVDEGGSMDVVDESKPVELGSGGEMRIVETATKMRAELTQIGRDKAMSRLSSRIESLKAALTVEHDERSRAWAVLKQYDALRSPLCCGSVQQNTTLYLQARCLGLANMGNGGIAGGGGLVRALASSTEKYNMTRKHGLRFLWTVTGHWYSAYCCLFDRSGRCVNVCACLYVCVWRMYDKFADSQPFFPLPLSPLQNL